MGERSWNRNYSINRTVYEEKREYMGLLFWPFMIASITFSFIALGLKKAVISCDFFYTYNPIIALLGYDTTI